MCSVCGLVPSCLLCIFMVLVEVCSVCSLVPSCLLCIFMGLVGACYLRGLVASSRYVYFMWCLMLKFKIFSICFNYCNIKIIYFFLWFQYICLAYGYSNSTVIRHTVVIDTVALQLLSILFLPMQ